MPRIGDTMVRSANYTGELIEPCMHEYTTWGWAKLIAVLDHPMSAYMTDAECEELQELNPDGVPEGCGLKSRLLNARKAEARRSKKAARTAKRPASRRRSLRSVMYMPSEDEVGAGHAIEALVVPNRSGPDTPDLLIQRGGSNWLRTRVLKCEGDMTTGCWFDPMEDKPKGTIG